MRIFEKVSPKKMGQEAAWDERHHILRAAGNEKMHEADKEPNMAVGCRGSKPNSGTVLRITSTLRFVFSILGVHWGIQALAHSNI